METVRLALMGSMFVVVALLALALLNVAGAASRVRIAGRLRARDWQAKFDEDGNLVSLTDGEIELVSRHHMLNNTPRLQFGDAVHVCRRPRRMNALASEQVFDYRLTGSGWAIDVRYEITLEGVGSRSVALAQKVSLRPQRAVRQDFAFVLPYVLRLPVRNRHLFAPLKEGVVQQAPIDADNRSWAFHAAGTFVGQGVQLLAIPMIDEFAPDHPYRLTLCADPRFTTLFQVPVRPAPGVFQCVYKAQQAPLEDREERCFYTVIHPRDAEGALRNFYRTALAEVPAGPDWLHEVAMVGCDDLSDGGQGWFRDIDWLEQRLSPEDRGRVCLVLRGWYDLVGRYTYDHAHRRLADEWTAFPNAEACAQHAPRARPTPMSRDEVRRRLRYARDRGVRVLLYFADGLAVCEGAPGVYHPERLLKAGGPAGPQVVGATHIQNPLHPLVRQWYKDYLAALLREYGRHLDGLVWGETFQVEPGDLGPAHASGYAAAAMMSLVRELAAVVHQHRRGCAFLTADGLGPQGHALRMPYGLMADGVLQESDCRPETWPFGLFPSYRNVLWSCNWHPVSRLDWTREGVERYGAPVAISNGRGDDRGISEMPEEAAGEILRLFQHLKENRPARLWLDAEPPAPAPAAEALSDES